MSSPRARPTSSAVGRTATAQNGSLSGGSVPVRMDSPQPQSPKSTVAVIGEAKLSPSISMPNTSGGILLSRISASPAPLTSNRSLVLPAMPAATGDDAFAQAPLYQEVFSMLTSVEADSSVCAQLLSTDAAHSVIRQRWVDDLSGTDARRLVGSLLRVLSRSFSTCMNMPPSVAMPATVSESNASTFSAPHVHSASVSISAGRDSASPLTLGIRNAMLRPSFAGEVSDQPPPPMSPNSNSVSGHHSSRQLLGLVSGSAQATPSGESGILSFKPKARRESVESFSSNIVHPRSAVRNTNSIERSVDPEGFKTINDYTVLRHLGKGASGKVKLVLHHESGELRAVKIVRRSLVRKLQGPCGLERIKKEVAIMKKLNHKHIIKLHEVIDDPGSDKMYFVMQFVANGEVLPGLEDLPIDGSGLCQSLPEEKVVKYIRQAASGLIYLHNHGIVHFDIKPQNILCSEHDDVVLADFGVSELMRSSCDNSVECCGLGSPAFMAPEVSRGDKLVDGEAADTWSLGVTAFVMLFGVLPFNGVNVSALFSSIQQGRVEYPATATEVQIDFFRKIFCVQPSQRWSLRKLRQHPFLYNPDMAGQDAFANSVMMEMGMDDNGDGPHNAQERDAAGCASDDRCAAPSLTPAMRAERFRMAVTQADVDGALSRLVSPIMSDMDVISSSSTIRSSCSQLPSRSGSTSNESQSTSFSRAQSPRLPNPLPPSVDHGTGTLNPRAFMKQSCGGGISDVKETITPPMSRYSSLGSKDGMLAQEATMEEYRVRRDTQVHRELSASGGR